MLNISNFSSLFEVGVTLNIACVAIEYAQSYTSVVCNQVFNLEQKIYDACNDCKNNLIDETTIKSLPRITINNSSTETLITRYAERQQQLLGEIEYTRDSLKKNTANACEVKMMPSICYWSFLYGLVGLFLVGVEDNCVCSVVHQYWIALSCFGLLFVLTGWLWGESFSSKCRFLNFQSLKFTSLTFIIALILSYILLFLCNVKEITALIWHEALVVSIILLYANFLISAIIIRKQAKSESKKINDTIQSIKKKCDNLNKDVDSLQKAGNIGLELAAD